MHGRAGMRENAPGGPAPGPPRRADVPEAERWRPGVCVRPAGAHGMASAQRVGVADSSCPYTMPERDEPGICTGEWLAADAPAADVAAAAAAAAAAEPRLT